MFSAYRAVLGEAKSSSASRPRMQVTTSFLCPDASSSLDLEWFSFKMISIISSANILPLTEHFPNSHSNSAVDTLVSALVASGVRVRRIGL